MTTADLLAEAKANRIKDAKEFSVREMERRLSRISDLRDEIAAIITRADSDIAECEKRIANNIKLNEKEAEKLAEFEAKES